MSTTDDWLYSDDLDVNITGRDRLDSADSRVLDGDDLLDDVLIAPPTAPAARQTPTNDDELLGMGMVQEEETLEGSASARLNAEVMARTIQSRIDSSKTSQSVPGAGGSTIYSREPNRRNSFFIGNLTWWTTDLDLIAAVQEVGLKDVICIKFYENRANGQSKGYALVELANESLAMSAIEKFSTLTIHNQSPVVMYAAKISPHQFETKCNTVKAGGSISQSSSTTSTSSNASSSSKPKPQMPPIATSLPVAPPIRPPTAGIPGFPPPPIPGFRPPGLPTDLTGGLGLMGPPPPLPPGPPGLPNLPPGAIPGLGNPLIRPTLPGMSSLPPGMLGDQFKNIGMAAPHLNPAFLQEMAAQGGAAGNQKNIQNMAELFARFRSQAAAALGGAGGGVSPANGAKHPTEEEAADANQRNRAISSSAISRAMSDANTGDYEGAIDTLKMAITLIKQSVTSGTEASQILIQSLQDCLHSIEDQSTVTKRSSSRREHRSHDDRDRSRSSHRSSKHHRDRSRERRR